LYLQGKTVDDVRRKTFGYNRWFILRHWYVISDEEGRKRAPWMTQWKPFTATFFRCDCYDAEKKKCTWYGHRPKVCSDFPLYGKSFNALCVDGFPPKCGYRQDVIKAQARSSARSKVFNRTGKRGRLNATRKDI
jgi:Fe-S-cluster containining protein